VIGWRRGFLQVRGAPCWRHDQSAAGSDEITLSARPAKYNSHRVLAGSDLNLQIKSR